MNRISYPNIAGCLIFVGSIQFLFGLLLAEETYPDYKVSQTISDLGVARSSETSALIFNSSLIIQGILAIGVAYLLHLAYKRRLVSIFFGLGGTGAIGAAIFPENVGLIHLGVSIFSFFVAGLTPFVTLVLQRPPFSYISIALGTLSFMSALLLSQNFTFGLAYGAVERMVAYPAILWAIGFGAYLMSFVPKQSEQTSEAIQNK